jgi:hypothetical protein
LAVRGRESRKPETFTRHDGFPLMLMSGASVRVPKNKQKAWRSTSHLLGRKGIKLAEQANVRANTDATPD